MQYLTQIFMVALVCCVLALSSSVSGAKELTLPFGLQWGDSPQRVEDRLRTQCENIRITASQTQKNAIIYTSNLIGKRNSIFSALVGKNGLELLTQFINLPKERFDKNDALMFAATLARMEIEKGGSLSNGSDLGLYDIYTKNYELSIDVNDKGELWRIIIAYLPLQEISKKENFENEIKIILRNLDDLRR